MPGKVYLKTLRDMRGQIIVWTVGIAFVGAVNVLLYPTVQKVPNIVSFLENMPQAFKALLGDVREMVRLEGFLRMKVFDPLPLLLAIFAVSQGARLLAGEVDQKSIDLLMAQPVRRWRVVLEKYLAVATACLILCVALATTVIACTPLIDDRILIGYPILATLNGLPLTLLFAALALLGSCILSRPRQAALLAGSIVVASYVFETLRLTSPPLDDWRFLSLFAHHKAGYSLSGGLSLPPILLLLGITLLLIGAAIAAWERRDLTS